MIDHESEFGQRVLRRLQDDRMTWLTTVDSNGTPQPRPVWFLWTGQDFIVYSQPDTRKLDHIHENPQVALHLDGDGQGGDIIVLTGEARVDTSIPPANQVSKYVAKYAWGFERIGMTAQAFAQNYSVPIRVTPHKLRGH